MTKKKNKPADVRIAMEKTMADIGRLIKDKEFASLDEINDYVKTMIVSGDIAGERSSLTPLEEAQELIYQAYGCDGKERVRLARQALKISPDCADAYVILGEEADDAEKAKGYFEQGVAAGERALGAQMFAENAGRFWNILETRPYMRARAGLASCLWLMGETQAAIDHLVDLLRLNPNDNQGNRYLLADLYILTNQDIQLKKLLRNYSDDRSPGLVYPKALLAFKQSGAGTKAEKLLLKAFKCNKYVPLFLAGILPLPDELPEYMAVGSIDEAVDYVAASGDSWLNTTGALEWVAEAFFENYKF